jgi:hypothetical protein
MANDAFPVGFAAATSRAGETFPAGSPLSARLILGDVNVNASPYSAQTLSKFARHALSNHNLYVQLRAIIDANDMAFDRTGDAPQEIADLIGAISELFACEAWADRLTEITPTLRKVLPRFTELTSTGARAAANVEAFH